MAKIRVTSLNQAKNKIQNDWKADLNTTDTLVYDPSDVDGADIQLWAFKQGVLVNVVGSVGPFREIQFVATMV